MAGGFWAKVVAMLGMGLQDKCSAFVVQMTVSITYEELIYADNGALPLAGNGWMGSLGRDILILGQHPVFILNLVAYCPIQGAFGAYTFWGPKVDRCPTSESYAQLACCDQTGLSMT